MGELSSTDDESQWLYGISARIEELHVDLGDYNTYLFAKYVIICVPKDDTQLYLNMYKSHLYSISQEMELVLEVITLLFVFFWRRIKVIGRWKQNRTLQQQANDDITVVRIFYDEALGSIEGSSKSDVERDMYSTLIQRFLQLKSNLDEAVQESVEKSLRLL